MADDRPAESEVEAIARVSKELEDLRSTVMIRVSRRPTGDIEPTIRTTAKGDTLLLQGQTVNRADYPVLWQWVQDQALVVAGLFTAGNGTTTFGIPDFRGRVLLAAGAGAGGTYAVGATGGAVSQVLAINQMPAHDHNPWISVANHANHDHSFNTNGGGGHGGHRSFPITVAAGGGATDVSVGSAGGGDHSHGGNTTSDSAGSHAWNAGEDTIGGNTPVDLRQPYIAVNWEIWV